jgi:AraC family transcriptional regulator of adaptative response/methylated-DNA-[protein]-cysteine methyltransferase
MTGMNQLPTQATMWRAFAEKDSQFDGLFFVAVRTTGVFCRPTCRAKPPRRENVEFFATAAEAMGAGYRGCKLCHPTGDAAEKGGVVARLEGLARSSASSAGSPLRGRDLAAMGIDPSSARRQFRRQRGVTFAGYQRAVRMAAALGEVRGGAGATAAQVAAGFESASGFRRAFAGAFGVTASRGGSAAAAALWTGRYETPLGAMVGVASDEGVVVLDFADRRGLEGAIARVRARYGRDGTPAALVPGENEHLALAGRELAGYFAGMLRAFTVRLDDGRGGSAFERRAWAYLREIPYGQTRSYGEQARAIGCASARAVGRANGMNYVSIGVPCHRVVGADGALTGYGGGVWRKRWLLEHERRVAGARERAG